MSNSIVELADSVQLADLIERAVIHQTDVMISAVKQDREILDGCFGSSVDASFGDDITLRIETGNSRLDSVRVSALKIRGFWSDSVVSARISIDRLFQVQAGTLAPSLRVDVSSSSGGEDLNGLTQAEAYINKGKAIQIVAEAMSILESSDTMPDRLVKLEAAQLDLSNMVEERREQEKQGRLQAVRDALMADEDKILVNDVDTLIERAKALALDSEYGEKVVLVFHDGRVTGQEGEAALEGIAFFNNSTGSRRMTTQYFANYPVIKQLEREPSGGRGVEKMNLKDLKSFLGRGAGLFVSRSLSDPRLIEKLTTPA